MYAGRRQIRRTSRQPDIDVGGYRRQRLKGCMSAKAKQDTMPLGHQLENALLDLNALPVRSFFCGQAQAGENTAAGP